MSEELTRAYLDLQKRVTALEAYTQVNTHNLGALLGAYLALPNLRGFWPMSSREENGNALDLSGQGRMLTNTGGVGVISYNYAPPSANFVSASGTFFTRADEAGLDLTQNMTMGCWAKFSAIGSTRGVIGKSLGTGNQRSYVLYTNSALTPANAFGWQISVDGTATTVCQSDFAPSLSQWYFLVCRYTVSTQMKLWTNELTFTNTTSIPASIFNSTAAFQIGAFNAGTSLFDGDISLAFVCSAAVPDKTVDKLFWAGRRFFGV